MSPTESAVEPFEPRRPALLAGLVFVLAAADRLLADAPRASTCSATTSTSRATGSASSAPRCSAQTGRIPEWNPYLFGGLPFIAAQHGDIFYPTAWLRWILPIDTAMNLGFAMHFVLAGAAMYALLRALADRAGAARWSAGWPTSSRASWRRW